MTASKTIEIIVSPTGQSSLQTLGFTGSSCQEASRFLEQALGAQSSERLTAEFYQTQATGQQARERH